MNFKINLFFSLISLIFLQYTLSSQNKVFNKFKQQVNNSKKQKDDVQDYLKSNNTNNSKSNLIKNKNKINMLISLYSNRISRLNNSLFLKRKRFNYLLNKKLPNIMNKRNIGPYINSIKNNKNTFYINYNNQNISKINYINEVKNDNLNKNNTITKNNNNYYNKTDNSITNNRNIDDYRDEFIDDPLIKEPELIEIPVDDKKIESILNNSEADIEDILGRIDNEVFSLIENYNSSNRLYINKDKSKETDLNLIDNIKNNTSENINIKYDINQILDSSFIKNESVLYLNNTNLNIGNKIVEELENIVKISKDKVKNVQIDNKIDNPNKNTDFIENLNLTGLLITNNDQIIDSELLDKELLEEVYNNIDKDILIKLGLLNKTELGDISFINNTLNNNISDKNSVSEAIYITSNEILLNKTNQENYNNFDNITSVIYKNIKNITQDNNENKLIISFDILSQNILNVDKALSNITIQDQILKIEDKEPNVNVNSTDINELKNLIKNLNNSIINNNNNNRLIYKYNETKKDIIVDNNLINNDSNNEYMPNDISIKLDGINTAIYNNNNDNIDDSSIIIENLIKKIDKSELTINNYIKRHDKYILKINEDKDNNYERAKLNINNLFKEIA